MSAGVSAGLRDSNRWMRLVMAIGTLAGGKSVRCERQRMGPIGVTGGNGPAQRPEACRTAGQRQSLPASFAPVAREGAQCSIFSPQPSNMNRMPKPYHMV